MESASKPLVLVTEGSDQKPLNWLKDRAEVIEIGASEPGFEAQLTRAQGLLVRTYTLVDEALLARALGR